MCDTIATALTKSMSNLKFFLEMYQTIEKMKLYAAARSDSFQLLNKFEKEELKSSSGLTIHIY